MKKTLNLLLALTLAASVAAAQDAAPRRSGFWLNVGAGWGSAYQTCDNCTSGDRESGVSGQLALGGTLSPSLLLGVESNGWYKEESGIKSTLGILAAVAYWYPSATGNLFIKGGPGIAMYRFENSGSTDDTGFGFLVGVGYDLPVGKKFSITPVAAFQYGMMGDNGGAQGIDQNIYSFGATFTMH